MIWIIPNWWYKCFKSLSHLGGRINVREVSLSWKAVHVLLHSPIMTVTLDNLRHNHLDAQACLRTWIKLVGIYKGFPNLGQLVFENIKILIRFFVSEFFNNNFMFLIVLNKVSFVPNSSGPKIYYFLWIVFYINLFVFFHVFEFLRLIFKCWFFSFFWFESIEILNLTFGINISIHIGWISVFTYSFQRTIVGIIIGNNIVDFDFLKLFGKKYVHQLLFWKLASF